MHKIILSFFLTFILLPFIGTGQPCQISAVSASPLPCNDYSFLVAIDLEVNNPSSPGFTLAGNGVIYGTFLYSELPVVVGPLYGDPEAIYEFIAWDVENPECQNFISFESADCGPLCGFSNFSINFLQCINATIASIEIDFDVENPMGLTYDLYDAEGALVTTALYSSLPQLITNFTTNGADSITLTVCDHNNEACCQTFVLPAIDCSPNNCEFFNITADPECVNGNFVVHLDFEIDNPASDSFTVNGNSLNYGTFGYNELPILLGPLNGGSILNWEFIIRDKTLPTCVGVAVLGQFNCPPPCDILTLEANALECNGDDAFALEVDVEIEGEGDTGYSIFSESHYYGTYNYDNLPLVIPDFEVNNFVDQVTVCDNENPGCCSSILFEALLCNGCLIYNLEADALPCNDEGEFFISINFDYQNVSDLGFSITGNGNNYGNYAYEEVPILLGPFPGDGSQFLEFVITDLVNDFCFDATEIGVLPCDSICELSNLEVETGECTGNGTYILQVDFDHSGALGNGFDLYINGEFYDFFDYDELPLTLLEFPSNGPGLDTISVCDNDNNDCCTLLVFEAPDCECSIYETTVQNLACTSDSTFAISVEFFTENLPGGNFVDVFLDGLFIGFYNIENLPLIIENIPEGDGTAILTICANDAADCCDNVLIELMDCLDAECTIWDLFAEQGNCSSDSTYLLDIVFNHINLPSDSVNISANNHFIGTFFVTPDFIRIENFPVYEESTTTITVCATGNDDCCDTYTFETPDCDPTDCDIRDLIAVPGDCLTDSTYSLVIEYISENIPGDSVIVTANGNVIDTFVDPEGHIVIEHFPWFDGDIAVLTVCSFAHPDCCDSYEFEIPNCPGGECNIFDLLVEVGDCLSDSTYLLVLDFQFEDLPTDSVVISTNEETLGTYLVNEGHIVIDDFPLYQSNHTAVHVCAQGAPDCCDVVEFETPICNTECAIEINFTEYGNCGDDSTYVFVVDFEFQNLPTDSVVISTQNEIIGTFHVHEGHILIENFPAYPSNNTAVFVCAQGAPDCCDDVEFETPDCGTQCNIDDLFAEPGVCTSDSTFLLDIVFNWQDLPTDSVLIYANDHFIGTFHTDPEFIRIENFPILGEDNTNLLVCALGAPDCCDSYSFVTPECGIVDECIISQVSVLTFECNSDSTFGVIINFHYENITHGGFDVYTGNQYLGFYTLDQIPIETSQFPSNGSGEYVITICENDNSDCCTSYEFEGPVCTPGGCDIYDLDWSITECDSAGNFFFILDFNFHDIGAEGFTVAGNGNNYGNFSYDDLPIEIGPFESNNTIYEFVVTDNQFGDCSDFVVPGNVECFVATNEIDHEEVFSILNNGSTPGILVKKDLVLSLYHSSGKMIVQTESLKEGSYFEMNSLPSGLYIATILYQGNSWPVKLIKGSY
jgi:hypothetical protein